MDNRAIQTEDLYVYAKSKIEYHLSDICNLRCKGCDHGLPITNAKEPFVSLEEFGKDISRAHEIFPDAVLSLLGGEPLLNPRITEYLYLVRKLCPTSVIALTTNSTLVSQMGKDFFTCLRDSNILLRLTHYIADGFDEAVTICEYNNVMYSITRVKTFAKFLVPKGLNRIMDSNCGMGRCHLLHHGYLYPCNVSPLLHKVSKRFNVPTSYDIRSDRVYIHKDYSEDELQKLRIKMALPGNICRYCKGFSYMDIFKWEQKEPEVSDYICEE